MASPDAAVLAKGFHLHSAAVICPGCPGYALDPGHMPRICPGSRAYAPDPGHIRGISGANHISNRLDKRKVSSYVFYSFVLQLSQSSVKLQVDFLHKYGAKNRS